MHPFKKQVLKVVGILMLAVFLYGITPRDYLHDLFAGHTDTVDCHSAKQGVTIESKHTHCYFLLVDFGAYLATAHFYIPFRHLKHEACYFLPYYKHFHSLSVRTVSLRGPPSRG